MTSYGSQAGDPEPGKPEPQYTPPPYQQPPNPDYGRQQSNSPPPPAPAAPAPRKNLLLLIAGLIVLGLLLLCGGGAAIVGGVFSLTQGVANAGDAYMTALRDGDYNKAFDMSTGSLQQEVGSAEGLGSALSSKQPATSSFASRNINNNDGTLSGTTTYKSGGSGTVDMVLSKVGNDWKVSGISLK